MPVIMNQPLPDDHPLKRGLIICGQKRPNSSEVSSTNTEQTPEPSTKQGWTEEDFKKGEEALNAALAKHPQKGHNPNE